MCGSPSRRALLGVAIALAAAGCLAAIRGRSAPERFDHGAHARRELTCADCHGGAGRAERAPMPATAMCRECHDARKEPAFVTFTASVRPASYGDAIFSHAPHAEAGIACATCHTGAERAPLANPSGPLSMDACIACHEERKLAHGRANDCAACHKTLRKDTPPRSHDPAWTLRHGTIARIGDRRAVAERCDACHTRGECDACHTANAPADHTNPFRLTTHGLAASMDRSRCLACHASDSCVRCHAEVRPRSHTAAFGDPQNRHCVRCHLPVSGTGCATCHAGAPSHGRAPPKPPSIPAHRPATTAAQCVACHRAISHVVRLDIDCNACHR